MVGRSQSILFFFAYQKRRCLKKWESDFKSKSLHLHWIISSFFFVFVFYLQKKIQFVNKNKTKYVSFFIFNSNHHHHHDDAPITRCYDHHHHHHNQRSIHTDITGAIPKNNPQTHTINKMDRLFCIFIFIFLVSKIHVRSIDKLEFFFRFWKIFELINSHCFFCCSNSNDNFDHISKV